MKHAHNFIDEEGNIYTRLRVREFDGIKERKAYWKVFCDPELGGCGNTRAVIGSDLRSGKTQSCGCLQKERASEANKGKTLSKEHRQKLSETKQGENHPMFGKKRPEHSKRMSGENNPAYNPDLTDEERQDRRFYPEYYEWRKAVYERDDYVCRCCGKHGGKLNAHHLESYAHNSELRTLLENGITLCENCHKNFHHQCGRGNNTKGQFDEFLGGTKL